MRVAVVGAGLSGLVFSRCMLNCNIVLSSLSVLEERCSLFSRSERPIGMVMSERSSQFLQKLVGGEEPLLGNPLSGRMFYGKHKKQFVPFGSCQLGVSRSAIVQRLARDQEIECGVTNVELEQKKDSGTVAVSYIQNKQKHSLEVDLVVGCDGRNSIVRKKMVGNYEERKIDHCWKSVVLKSASHLRKDVIHIVPLADGFIHIMKVDTCDQESVATLVLTKDAMLRGLSGEYFVALRDLLDVSELLELLHGFGHLGEFSTIHCKSFHKGNVVLLGDAAHGTVIFAGQGMNMAFEDALCLSNLLQNQNILEALSRFSETRVPEMEAMHKIGMHAYKWLFKPFPSWRIVYQQKMSNVFGRKYPKSLYSMINTVENIPFTEALRNIEKQNKCSTNAIPTNLGLDHVGIIVPNVTDAMHFLMDAFDCVFDWEVVRDPKPTSGERGWDKIFGVHPDSYMPHVAMVKCGSYHLTQYVELFEWVSPDQYQPNGQEKWFKFSDVGNSYIAFTVGDIAKVVDHLREVVIPKYGVRFIQDPPMSFPLRGELCTSFFITTPWGQWIEISEWSKSTPIHPHLRQNLNREEEVVFDSSSHNPALSSIVKSKEVGQALEMLETPAVFVDLSLMERNVDVLLSKAKEHKVAWIAVAKAHKSPQLAQRLVDKGAIGVLIMTVADAEIMSVLRSEHKRLVIFVANIVNIPSKLTKLVNLAASHPQHDYRVNVDHVQNVADLENAAKGAGVKLHVMVELNVGHNRTGVSPEEAVELVRLINRKSHLVFDGISGYEGHTPVLPPDRKLEETKKSHSVLAETAALLKDKLGVAPAIISGGGSSNYPQALAVGVLNELQAGGVALCDKLYLHQANLADHNHVASLFVESTVISVNSHPLRAIADAGFKSVGLHPFAGSPLIVNYIDHCAEVFGLSAEHLRMRSLANSTCDINMTLGQRIRVIPGYGDSFLGSQKKIFGVRDGKVEDVFIVG